MVLFLAGCGTGWTEAGAANQAGQGADRSPVSEATPTVLIRSRLVEPRCFGQTVYVPLYSHVYDGDRAHPFLLAAMASIRNPDPTRSIMLRSVEYFDSEGRLARSFLPQPQRLGPMASTRFFIPESDTTGGAGASFLVKWDAEVLVIPPVIESVMIGTRGQQGISFTSRGVVLRSLEATQDGIRVIPVASEPEQTGRP